jgi:uncharacterized integral membrane protein
MATSSKVKMITGIVIGIVGAVIALQNLQPVNTVVLLWRFTMPHVLLLAIMLSAGFVLGIAVSMMLGAKYLSE